ncbi:MAG TPA: aryl-sulfate sulfotransferase [Bryobacteraceae bacterium]|nr:aryl-sulfate sulfotransferase [Bryobacteraceae bacterium]
MPIVFLLLLAGAADLHGAISVALSASVPAPVPVGYVVSWTAEVTGANDPLWYRFRTRLAGGEFAMLRDYGPDPVMEWTASDREGLYEIEVSVQNRATMETVRDLQPYEFFSQADEGVPVLNSTTHPLVFLYSAPPCPEGSRMRVEYQAAGSLPQSTPFKPCVRDVSMNFYVGGLRQLTTYAVRHIVETESRAEVGPELTLTSGAADITAAGYRVLVPPAPEAANEVLIQSSPFQLPVATDLNGNLVWFYPGRISTFTRAEAGGYFYGLLEVPNSDPSKQILRKFDLTGATVMETNAGRVNDQLAALGMRKILSFHHEVRGTPDGRIMALATTEQIMSGVQGDGEFNILSDMIVVLDSQMRVVWAWDALEHLDIHREATLKDTCGPVGQGCSYFFNAPRANDWLHGNSLQETPDGHILYSSRSQDWVIKIDYGRGLGTGAVLWRLGKDGDFQIDSDDPNPWFSHQHDPQIAFSNTSELILFDNGNVRYEEDQSIHSRGQVYHIDEETRTAKLVLSVDLGTYSLALGAAQKLPNGNYHFDSGWGPGGTAQSLEVDPTGKVVYGIQAGVQQYRTFRMKDIYTP